MYSMGEGCLACDRQRRHASPSTNLTFNWPKRLKISEICLLVSAVVSQFYLFSDPAEMSFEDQQLLLDEDAAMVDLNIDGQAYDSDSDSGFQHPPPGEQGMLMSHASGEDKVLEDMLSQFQPKQYIACPLQVTLTFQLLLLANEWIFGLARTMSKYAPRLGKISSHPLPQHTYNGSIKEVSFQILWRAHPAGK
jgi:hypothetical protein